MVKKIFIVIGILLVGFIVLAYLSFWSQPQTPKNSLLINKNGFDSISYATKKWVTVAASSQYDGNNIKHLMQGEHYRKTWEAPVKAKIVYLDTLFGGMTFIEEGGGKQTKSLELKAPNGIVYTLRSINKNPEALIPQYAKLIGIENLIIDGISAQHPYGALPAAYLAEKLHVLHTHPKLIYLPKQYWLNERNEEFGNKLYFLEYESEGKKNWTSITNVEEIIDTKDLIELKYKKRNLIHIDEAALVRARLLDLYIGDWDRHAKQWGWAMQKRGDSLIGIPIAADRDNAFFTLDGILPTLLSNKTIEPKLRPFEEEIDYLPGLLYDFDSYFLKDTPEETFLREAKFLQQNLTDDVIENALRTWPKPIYDLDAKTIEKKLKKRRDDLMDYAIKFKTILNDKPRPTEPLIGLEDIDIPRQYFQCFSCILD
ncbi:hypothetical protein ACFQO1_12045 [Jejudonia soesokkakensis]|uniref:Uncharacterized protein n=1 Tax=Jejudonia soesokkakensis TaxID=1323432 RepID=A0ABW2MXN2_9FLAO